MQTRDTHTWRDKTFPKEHGAAHPKVTIHAPGTRNWPVIYDRNQVSGQCHYGLTGGQ